ncbi:MAG: beta-RFAP synthase [Gemmataceae bacterium]
MRITTGSRLHFGLLALGGPRRFGGVGLMIDSPALRLSARPADQWHAEGPLAERALTLARRFEVQPHHLCIETAPPEHSGFGTGTQLALAVGRLLTSLPVEEIIRRTGRGQRSAIGTHGFVQGGLLVDGGRKDDLAPLLVRYPFPEEWRIVVALPITPAGLSGPAEIGAFARLRGNRHHTDDLCRLTLLGMLPAVLERDLATFAEALGEYNAKSGELFAPVQGGPYTSGPVSELIAHLRSLGLRGIGQSSWGPAVFAITDAEQAQWLCGQLRERVSAVWMTQGRNQGALLEGCAIPGSSG